MDFLDAKLKSDAGFARVEKLDPIAKKFTTAEDKAAIVAEAQAVVAGLSGEPHIESLWKTSSVGDVLLLSSS